MAFHWAGAKAQRGSHCQSESPSKTKREGEGKDEGFEGFV